MASVIHSILGTLMTSTSILLCLTSLLCSHLALSEEVEHPSNEAAWGSLWRCPKPCPACPAPPSCQRYLPPGYRLYEGLGYYKMHYEELSWYDALAACEREGADLVVFNSQAEADLANSLMNKYSIPYIQVGFFDVNKKGTYVTVLGDSLTSTGYVVWDPVTNEPNGVGKENCGSFRSGRGLNDIPCFDNPRPFLCELS